LASLRQSFLNGSLTRLIDPDSTLRGRTVDFVSRGEFGLASGQQADGSYERVWFCEPIAPEEVAFEPGVFLLTKAKAQALRARAMEPAPGPDVIYPVAEPSPIPQPCPSAEPSPAPEAQTRTVRVAGAMPPEVWNRFGTKILPKLRTGTDLKVGVDFLVTVDRASANSLISDLQQILDDLGLKEKITVRDSA
jgi:hypothetical protein